MKKICILLLMLALMFTMFSCDIEPTLPEAASTDSADSADSADTSNESDTKEDIPVTEPVCTHTFAEATCTAPKTCTLCGITEGTKLPHNSSEATCTEAPRCSVCKKITGKTLGHNYVDDKCTRCGDHYPTIHVSCIGDSITAGGYWKLLSNHLLDEYNVKGFGVSGSTGYAAGLDGNPPKPLAYIDQDAHQAAKQNNPHIVVIMLGTNDSKSMNADRIKADNGEQYKTDMITLVNEYKNLERDPQIFIALPPVSFRPENGGISNVNIENLIIPLLKDVAEETGAIIIDTHEATQGKDYAFPDGVHPNADGQDILAKTIAYAIMAAEEPSEVN
ncbi:MAG: hypothetical protein E7643_05210 [Ruminococcaceae bacterium]|nr:hypothetical protein [Oscillospiraceae bacterium]